MDQDPYDTFDDFEGFNQEHPWTCTIWDTHDTQENANIIQSHDLSFEEKTCVKALKAPVYMGLQNTGNSCYLNAALQIFLHDPNLFVLLKNEFFPEEDLTVLNLYKYVGAIRSCYSNETHINVTDQCDSSLLFCWILDRIKDRFLKEQNQESLMYFQTHLEQIAKLKRTCEQCNHQDSVTHTEFCPPLYIKEAHKEIPELVMLINQNNAKIVVEKKCDHCGSKSSIQKKNTIHHPDNLFFNIQAHRQHLKITERFELKDNRIYDLKGFVAHIGQSVDYGHYVFYGCNDDDNWIRYDDDTLTKYVNMDPFYNGTYPESYSVKMVWYRLAPFEVDSTSDSEESVIDLS